MNKFIKLACLTIVFTFSAHAMQNDADLGEQLLTAARAGDHKKIEQLIKAGAPVDYADERCCITALIIAAIAGHLNCVQLLLAAKAHVNQPGYNGLTALIYAALNNKFECAQALIAAGAKVNQTAKYGSTAWGVATSRQSQPICELLVERMLWIPNQEQKKSMCIFLALAKRYGKQYSFATGFISAWKAPLLAAVYKQNKNNFVSSIAYHEVAKLPESNTKKALLEKYNLQPTASNSQSEG
jgi:hypothetical protein